MRAAGLIKRCIPLVAGGLLLCLAAAAVPARANAQTLPERGARQVPVTNCPITPGAGVTFSQPAVPATTVIPASVSVPPGATVFGTGDQGFGVKFSLAPLGFACSAIGAGADGGFAVQVTDPSARQYVIRYDYNPGGAGPNIDDACPYIPAVKAADAIFRQRANICGRAGAETVTQVATGFSSLKAAIVQVPPTVKDTHLPAAGDGRDETVAVYVAQLFAGSQANAQDAGCTLPAGQKAICLAALKYFVTQSLAARAAGPILTALTAELGVPASTHSIRPGAVRRTKAGTPVLSRSELSSALPGRSQVPFTVPAVLKTLGVVVLLIVLVGFPAEIFNRTLEENYAEVRGWFRRPRRPAAVTSRFQLPSMGQFAVFCVAAALLSTLVDPEIIFRETGWIGKGGLLFVGFLVAIPLTTLVYAVPGEQYAARYRACPHGCGCCRSRWLSRSPSSSSPWRAGLCPVTCTASSLATRQLRAGS